MEEDFSVHNHVISMGYEFQVSLLGHPVYDGKVIDEYLTNYASKRKMTKDFSVRNHVILLYR